MSHLYFNLRMAIVLDMAIPVVEFQVWGTGSNRLLLSSLTDIKVLIMKTVPVEKKFLQDYLNIFYPKIFQKQM